MVEPMIRASYAKELVHAIDALALTQRDRVHARLTDGVAARVLATPSLSLVSGADHQALMEAAFAELDEAAFVALIRQQTAKYRQSAFIAATITTLQRLVGKSPHGLLKHLPKLRDATVQGYGTLAYTRGADNEAHFALSGYPPQYMTPANSALFVATFLGALDVIGTSGEAMMTSVDRELGKAQYLVRWPKR